MAALEGYLSGKVPFDNQVLMAISKSRSHFCMILLTSLADFLDHVMRQWPSMQYKLIKRSFFTRGTGFVQLDNYVSALKGVYSSIRLCSLAPSTGGKGSGLAVNVDVANGTFWSARKFYQDRSEQAILTICRGCSPGCSELLWCFWQSFFVIYYIPRLAISLQGLDWQGEVARNYEASAQDVQA